LSRTSEEVFIAMRGFFGKTLKSLLVVFVVFVGIIGVVLGFLHSPFFKYPTDGEYPPPRINELIWPTIGYPAMVVPGGVLEVEVDLWVGEESTASEASAWKAEIRPARDELAGLSYALEFAGAEIGASRRWPYRSMEGRSEDVWHVSFRVPAEAPPELYDLRIEAEKNGEYFSDGQPHAVALVEEDDNDFTFVTLSDIHVHERDNSSLLSKQTNQGISEDGEPVFFENAIDQVNLIKPDFVVMLGDYIRGQRRPGELESEYEKFYQALLELKVPAFLLPGNHDGYINEIDGARWYENNIGPLYFSFDVGDCHFTCLDTYEWPRDDRVVMNKLFYMEPRKWQGQVLGMGEDGDPSRYTGQLAWVEEDLAGHAEAPLRIMALHHDPYTPDGKGFSYINVDYYGIFRTGGGGRGRETLLDFASRFDVDMVFGGHLHTDDVGLVPWEDGTGETLYSCQTCVYFDAGGVEDHYPGYRLVKVRGGEIASFAYLDGVSSYPFYDGSVPGGNTDLDLLDRPALEARDAGGDSESRSVSFTVDNYLRTAIEVSGLVAPVPESPAQTYNVEGGELYRVVDMPGTPGWVLLYLRAEVGAGIPGEAADRPGDPAEVTVTVRYD
jgi:3',5'-cyclic AMP phosphodiesterase CpdA